MIQKLNDNNIPPTHIMQLSGHRNVQSVNNYSTVSNEQQKNMSLILSGDTTSTSIEKKASVVFTKWSGRRVLWIFIHEKF